MPLQSCAEAHFPYRSGPRQQARRGGVMPRPFRPMTPYPTDGPWKMTTIRVPEWMRDAVNERAVMQRCEPWVSLMDLLVRTQQLPPSRIPEWPMAVRRRYGTDLSDDGMLSTGQMELGAMAARAFAFEDDEAEAYEAAGHKPKRSSRTRARSSAAEPSTSAGTLNAVVRKHTRTTR